MDSKKYSEYNTALTALEEIRNHFLPPHKRAQEEWEIVYRYLLKSKVTLLGKDPMAIDDKHERWWKKLVMCKKQV